MSKLPVARFLCLAVAFSLVSTLPLRATDSARTLYNKGRDAEARDDYEHAYEFYKEAFEKNPKDLRYKASYQRMRFLAAASHVHRGQLLRDSGKLQEALTEFQAAAQIDPSSFIPQQEIARTQKMIQEATAPPAEVPKPPEDVLSRMISRAAAPTELAPIAAVPITIRATEDAKRIYSTVGQMAGINVLFDPEWQSHPISIDLNGVNLQEALNIIALLSKTFWRVVTPNTIYVAQDTQTKRRELEQNVLKTFFLSNLNQATELQEVVNTMRSVLNVTHIAAIASQNAIVVRGTPDQLALADKLVNDFDKAPPEVVVDVVVMQVSRDKLHDLGIQPPASVSVALQCNVSGANCNTTTSATTNGTTTPATTPTTGSTGQINLNQFANLNATNFLVTMPAATANFLLSDSKTRILEKPQLRSSDGQKATLKIGNRIPVASGSYQAGVGGVGINPLVNTQFTYLDVGVNVDITPHVHSSDREITLKMSLEISSVTSFQNIGGIQEPVIGQRKAEQEIRLRDGEVNLLGGILEDQDIDNLTGIPGLANVPILKYLFSESHKERTENELVFVLVPHIVRGTSLDERNLRAIDIGTENNIELRQTATQQGTGAATNGAVTQVGPNGATAPAPSAGSPGSTYPLSTPVQTAPAPVQTAPAPAQPAPQTAQPPVAGTTGASPEAQQPVARMQAQPQQAGAAPNLPSVSGETVASFDPATIEVPQGNTFTVNVALRNAKNIFSFSSEVKYDPNQLELINSSNASLLQRDQQVVVLTARPDPQAGSVMLSASRPPNAGGINGDGPVFTLTFLAKRGGRSTLSFSRVGARDPNNQAVALSNAQAQVVVK
ncbi:MAG TPA: cohesin domain-containing protein [Terriglobales bacterium]|nr:cohesin domain-containing protein [Terriglobales bacterium]